MLYDNEYDDVVCGDCGCIFDREGNELGFVDEDVEEEED